MDYDMNRSNENRTCLGFRMLSNAIHYVEFKRPLCCFTLPGILIVLIGTFIGLYFMQTYYSEGSTYYGPMLLMMPLILVGFFMASTGLILHTIKRITYESSEESSR